MRVWSLFSSSYGTSTIHPDPRHKGWFPSLFSSENPSTPIGCLMRSRGQSRRQGKHQTGHVGGKIKIGCPSCQVIKHSGHTADGVTERAPGPREEPGEMRLAHGVAFRNMDKAGSIARWACCPHPGYWVQWQPSHRGELSTGLPTMAPVTSVEGEVVTTLIICDPRRVPEKGGRRNR